MYVFSIFALKNNVNGRKRTYFDIYFSRGLW